MVTTGLILRSKSRAPLNRLARTLLHEMPEFIDSLDAFELETSATSIWGDGTKGAITISLIAERFENLDALDLQQVSEVLKFAEAQGFDLVIEGPEAFLQALDDHIARKSEE